MPHEIRLTIVFTPRMTLFLLVMALVAAVPLELGSETMIMSTTYPSPVGIYARLITTGGPVGGPGVNTILNRDNGKVGIGTTGPTNPLSVAGNADFSGNVLINGSLTLPHTVLPAANGGTGLSDSGTNPSYFLASDGKHAWQLGYVAPVGSTWSSATITLGKTFTNTGSTTMEVLLTFHSPTPSGTCAGATININYITIAQPVSCVGGSQVTTSFLVPPGQQFTINAVNNAGRPAPQIDYASILQ